jgi:baseplate J-like protein
MPLPQPKLDDKSFDVLVEESIKLIPRQSPDWTDHNRHDPGITLVEMFAWLAEMQQFYLNSVGPDSYLKFLRLLGTKPRSPKPAQTEILFSPGPGKQFFLPRGTKLTNDALASADQLVFETKKDLLVLPITLKKVLTSNQRGLKDNTDANGWDGLSYFAFGEEAEANSRLYLGFDQAFPASQTIALTLNLFDDYLVPRATHDDERDLALPSALVVWEYANTKDQWAPLDIVAWISAAVDRLALSQTGPDCLAWIQPLFAAVFASAQYTLLPQAARDLIDAAFAEANSAQDVFDLLVDPSFSLARGDETSMFSQSGRFFFSAPADMKRRVVHPFNQDDLFWLRATVRKPGYELAPKIDSIGLNTIGASHLDTITEITEFAAGEKANQIDASSYLALYGLPLVQVRERDGRWQDWEARADLDSSGPNDNHYVIKTETLGPENATRRKVSITFGDGKHGRIPPPGDGQIRLISYLPEFTDSRLLGRSNGLPRQAFAFDRESVVGETLKIQVYERVELPPTSTESTKLPCFLRQHRSTRTRVKSDEVIDLSCLLRLHRTTRTRVNSEEVFEVQLKIEARQELCEVSVREVLAGDLRLVSESTSGDVAPVPINEHEFEFHIGRLRAGSTATRTYELTSGAQGGSICGKISVSTSRNCPTESEASPVSTIEIGDSLADSRWRDWIRVDDFDSSGPGDPHFVFDAGSVTVTFGDGINGDIPQAADDRNIRIISLQTCGSADANVPKQTIRSIAKPFSVTLPPELLALTCSQLVAASGGEAGETIADAQVRARKDLRTQSQAVTSPDFEFLALHTPGLRVARAKAIPLFSAAHKPNPRATVTVIVLPYSLLPKPVPSENFRRTVCRHLDRHRLITTQIEVVAPNYVRVSVAATVMLKSGFDIEASRVAIIKALERFLRPIPEVDDTENNGWPFGRTVYKSEIYQLIENVAGMDCVENVGLSAEGVDAGRDENGNITISPLSVVFSGNHQVEVLTPQVECRRARE